MIITKIAYGQKDKNRVNIYIDGKFALAAPVDAVIKLSLFKGLELDDDTIEQIKNFDEGYKARIKALDIISRRAHGKKELIQKLVKKGVGSDAAVNAAEHLEEKGYINDDSFAAMFSRHLASKGFGNRRIIIELRKKGINKDICESAASEVCPDNCYDTIREIIEKKLRGDINDQKERQRIIRMLLRLGYDFDDFMPIIESMAD